MKNEKKQEIALFKFSVISPLVSGTYEDSASNMAFFRDAAKQTYNNHKGEKTVLSPATIKRWYYDYIRDGFEGLLPKCRNDAGTSRKLDDDMMEQIKYLKKEYPKLPATIIHQKLIDNGTINRGIVSLSTVNRYVNILNLKEGFTNNKDMRRYERPHINEVWYADSSVGPYIKIDGKKKRVWIIAVIEDSSRMIAGINLFFNDNTINVMSVLKSAVSKFGRPSRLSVDNGSSYKNKQIKLLAARIGMTMQYNPPYTPTSKSKIERFFKTLKSQWMSGLNMNDFKTLDELKESLMSYIQIYNQREHSSLNGSSPMDRFFSESELIKRLSLEQIERDFLFEIERRVSADNVILIDETEYEVNYRYSKQKITLRYSPDMGKVFIIEPHTGELSPIRLLNKHENSNIRREKVQLTGGNI